MLMQDSDGSAFTYDSFIRVNPRKKRKGKNKVDDPTPCDRLTRVREELEADGSWSLGCTQICREALAAACIKPQKVLCLGLGSPSSSRDARAQLAFLGCLCASFAMDSDQVFVYDPVFTDVDKQLFQILGMRCLDHVQGAVHALDRPTILYMPHCDLNLYETVIRANWTLEGLCNLVFLANRFSDYVDNNSVSKLEKGSPCLMKLVPFIECRPLPTSDAFPSAFNNMALQYVNRTPLSLQGSVFWDILD
ncbi:SRR1 domain containing protein [Tylopilus felleus]